MQFLRDHNKTAVVYGSREYSYREIIAGAAFYSRLLGSKKQLGTDPLIGPRVAIFSENRPEWILAYYGIWYADCVAVTVDFMSTPEEVAYIFKDCGVDAVFCSDKTKAVLEQAVALLENKPEIFNVDQIIPDLSGVYEFKTPNMDAVSVIIYTSGTTGSPKGVMITFGNFKAMTDTLVDDVYGKENRIFYKEDSILALLPYHHIYPLLSCLVVPVYAGATIGMIRELTADEIFSVCQKTGTTRMFGVTRLYVMFHKGIMNEIKKSMLARVFFRIAKIVNSKRFSRLIFAKVHKKFGGCIKGLYVGGSKMDTNVSRDFESLGFNVLEGYGMTETSPSMTLCFENDHKIGTVGRIIPCGEAVIKNGEFCFKGLNVMKGYYNRPEETAAMFDSEGYLHTGDSASIDKNGYITITGRIKEIIVLPNGKNINPEEMENELLGAFPVLKDVGVIDRDGKLFAVVYPDFQKMKDDQIINIRETIKWEVIDRYNVKASHHKKIMDFAVVDKELPRTRIGKLRRFALAGMIDVGDKIKTDIAEPTSEEYIILKETIQDMLGTTVKASDHLELDLNMDSLDRVELQVRVETNFGFVLTNEDISQYPKIADLAEFIAKSKTKAEIEKTDWGTILRQKLNFSIPRRTYMIKILIFLSRPVFKLYLRLRPSGIANIPTNTPVVFAPNHQSMLDGLIIFLLLKRRLRSKTYFFAKDRNFKSGFRQFFASKANIILININKNLKETLQQMAAIIHDGNNVVIFPEGARSRDGNVMPFKKTFAIIAKELGIPVVPVVIDGSYKVFSVGSKIPRPGKINVKFLPPVRTDDKDYEKIVAETHNAIVAGITNNKQ